MKTQQFVELYKAGDDDAARALYPDARTHWERIETVAESFGDLDPKMDAREADLEPGQKWTGWHRSRRTSGPPAPRSYTRADPRGARDVRRGPARQHHELDRACRSWTYTIDQIANGSRGLLEEVATGKVTGEEEYWSRTDLWDFQANVDGARVGFEGVKPIVEEKDPELAEELDRPASTSCRRCSTRSGWATASVLRRADPDEVKALADAVNALSEPLSILTAAVMS